MIQRSKTFSGMPAKYYIIGADTSMTFAVTDDEMEDILDRYEARQTDVLVYKLDQTCLFSDPSFNADRD